MYKNEKYEVEENSFNVNLDDCKFLGSGTCGSVYLMPNGKAIKIFKKEKTCKSEYEILEAVKGDKHFPKVYECVGNSMIREYISGTKISEYIKKNELSRKLSINLIEMIESFRKNGFTRLDMRCAHIFVQEDESVRVIDPRASFTKDVPYPHNLLKGLRKRGVLQKFMSVLKEVRPDLYADWSRRI